ncbi:LytTR family DNA-binding domain-containing protein [Ichthyenterobacterium sp. W332]|uniref:LytTR family DNA-binding domain-containing protein n=1 Tax=Microcosmobacter mediterraneus TaxID=3075607 RepID=A0ABU2YHE9_9FLAO|nr:LytTR family DNA-binding domain-containing protein [Ichthyenterobacterium sp. W332]MDT0557566.1 LytTR family DNA-binding domain-containing protein [Ichthyenterobacterium sp. W332]
MRVVIIEDEIQAVRALEYEIKTYCKAIEICGNADTIESAINLITKEEPELIFLDVQLKDGNGFEILQKIEHQNFKVIFTTAYSEYALNAIKMSALDYLLKPVDTEELLLAIEKAKKELLSENKIKLENFIKNQTQNPLRNKIAIKTSKGIHIYKLDSIIRIQSEGNYSALYFDNGKKEIVAKVLKDFEQFLVNFGFVRIHHSHIINLAHLKSYVSKDGGYVILNNKSTLPVSKRKKTTLLSLLNGLNN